MNIEYKDASHVNFSLFNFCLFYRTLYLPDLVPGLVNLTYHHIIEKKNDKVLVNYTSSHYAYEFILADE